MDIQNGRNTMHIQYLYNKLINIDSQVINWFICFECF